MLSPSFPLQTLCKSIHSFGQFSFTMYFSVPCDGRNQGKLALLPSFSPCAAQNMLVFSLQPWPREHQNLPLPILQSVHELVLQWALCSDYPHLSYFIFLKKNKFQGFLWRSFKSYKFSVVSIFHLFSILRAKSSIEAAFSFTSRSLAVWELGGGSCRIFPSSVLSPQACVFG